MFNPWLNLGSDQWPNWDIRGQLLFSLGCGRRPRWVQSVAPCRLIRVIRFIRGFYFVVDKHHTVKELGFGADEILRAARRFELFVLRIEHGTG